MTQRSFRILGVQQIAIGNAQRAALHTLWCELLGLPSIGTFRSAAENVDEEILRAGVGAFAVEVDLMEPVDANSRPRVHEPPLNHIGLWVDDLAQAHAELTARGMRFTEGGIRRGASGHEVCFIHPKPSADSPLSGLGVLIELVQAPPELIAEYARLLGS